MPQLRKTSSDLPFLMVLLCGGMLLRLLWFAQLNGGASAPAGAGEATYVALALAEGRGFADAYFIGYGPTAHLLPLTPAIAGLLFWLFEPRTPAANLALLGWSLAQVGLAYFLLTRLFKRLGADPLTIKWATAFLCLVPVFVEQETIDFRYWEGAASLCLVAANLLLILHLDARKQGSDTTLVAGAGLASLTFFVSPPAGLAIGACWALYAFRRLSFLQIGKAALAGGVALGILVVPWAARNAAVLGTPVLLRSNTGLEIALANHPAALSTRPPEEVFADRVVAIHPFQGGKPREALKDAGGEVRYSARLGEETSRWIAAHPVGFATLSLRHLRQFYFPERWQMAFSQWDAFHDGRARLIALVHLAGLIALAAGLWRRRRGYGLLAVYFAVVALPYMLVQPIPRYSYLVFGPLTYLAVEGLVRLCRALAEAVRDTRFRPKAVAALPATR